MQNRRSTVDCAVDQVLVCRKKAARENHNPDSAAFLALSERILQQALENHNRTLRKASVWPPAFLMGYRPII